MPTPARMSRRDALRLLSAAGLAPLVASSGIFAACQAERRSPLDLLAPLWTEPAPTADMARIGRLWLEAQTPLPGIAELLAALGWPDQHDPAPEVLRQWLWQRQRDDWLASRVHTLQGFRLAHTEVQLYALAELVRLQAAPEQS